MEIKTVEDLFADDEKIVYHYTSVKNVDSILREGLLCSKDDCTADGKNGVYVVWSDDMRVRNTIAGEQACVNSKRQLVGPLCQVAINLKRCGITAKDIAPDLNREAKCGPNSFCCKIVKDIHGIKASDISDWQVGNSDTYGIDFYDLEGYNIEHMPQDYDYLAAIDIYPQIAWKEYK